MTNLLNWRESIDNIALQVTLWFETLDYGKLFISAIVVLAVYLFRHRLAHWCVLAAGAVFHKTSITLSDHVRSELTKTTEVLLVSVAILLAIDFIGTPEVAGGILHRIIVSVIVIAVFGGLLSTQQYFFGRSSFGAI